MTYNSDRLDRIESDLETVKEILLATARRAEAADKRITTTNEELAQLSRKTDERLNRLSEDVETAFETISLMAENNRTEMAEFRAEMREARLETRQIWNYLMWRSQNSNGNGDKSA